MNAIYIARNRSVAYRRLGDEILLMSSRDPNLFTLNGVGALLWESADGKTPLGEIVARRVLEEYDVTQEEALRDAEEFARSLAEQGVLRISDRPISD
jgi:hypothetical protein